MYAQGRSNAGVLFASIPNFADFYSEDVNEGMECIRLLNEIIVVQFQFAAAVVVAVVVLREEVINDVTLTIREGRVLTDVKLCMTSF